MNLKFFLCFLCVCCLYGCKKKETNPVMPTEPQGILTSTPEPTKGVITSNPVPTQVLTENTVTLIPSLMPVEGQSHLAMCPVTEMPKSRVLPANLSEDKIPIEEDYFSDAVFREFIKTWYDLDGDGFLSKQERDSVKELRVVFAEEDGTSISFPYGGDRETPVVLDGLNWFPNITRMDQGNDIFSNLVVYFDHHPGIKEIGGLNAGGRIDFYIDSCDNLESIYFGGEEGCWELAFYVNNCKKLEDLRVNWLYPYPRTHRWLYLSNVPNLKLTLRDFLPDRIWLDSDAWIWGCERDIYPDGLNAVYSAFVLSEDGIPSWKKVRTEFAGRTVNVEWLASESVEWEEMRLKERMEQMYAMNMGTVSEEATDKDKISNFIGTVLFSPNKTSVYFVTSAVLREGDDDYKPLKTRFYIVEKNGEITGYDSFKELSEAADKREDLPSSLYDFFMYDEE